MCGNSKNKQPQQETWQNVCKQILNISASITFYSTWNIVAKTNRNICYNAPYYTTNIDIYEIFNFPSKQRQTLIPSIVIFSWLNKTLKLFSSIFFSFPVLCRLVLNVIWIGISYPFFSPLKQKKSDKNWHYQKIKRENSYSAYKIHKKKKRIV